MFKIVRFLGGAAVGAALGGAAAVLFAPQSGKQLQSTLRARADQARAAASAESAARERELRAEWEARVDAEAIKRRALKG
jgi:gas vesicle protein